MALPIHRLALVRLQSLRHGSRRATSLYTREALRGDASIAPYTQSCVVAKFMVSRRGGFHIRPGSLAQPRNCQEGSRPLPTDQQQIISKPFVLRPHTIPRGVEDAAPYGLHVSWRLPGAGRCKHRPLQSEGRDIRPRRGQSERSEKALRKTQHSCVF